MTTTPFLSFPTDAEAWRAFVVAKTDDGLARAREIVASLKDNESLPAVVVERWNDVDAALSDAGSLVSFLAETHPEREVRTLCEERFQAVQNYANELNQDRELFGVLERADGALASDGVDEMTLERRLLSHTLRDFRRAGVDRDDQTRERLRVLVEREVELGQEFSRVIREDVRSIRVTPERLAGLPEDYLEQHSPDAEGLVTITTDYPDIIPFRLYAHDAAARRELMTVNYLRGYPDNEANLAEILSTRDERARLLGYRNWPDYDADVKMVKTGDAIAQFIDRLRDLARPGGELDRDELLERLRHDRPEANGIDAADSAYYAEQVRREEYDVDAQVVRRYFDFESVRRGLLDVTGRLFGLRYDAVELATWHEDVAVYDVFRDDATGEALGRIYLDLFPREGKFKHAAQFTLVTGQHREQVRVLPEGALVCNFSRGLMEHSDVVTIFHEFGHLVHSIVAGDQRFVRFSGVATEWDFVEAPSQMLEEWAWDSDVLRSFAVDEHGDAIPVALVERMRAAREYAKASLASTQLFYAAVSYYLHANVGADISATVSDLQARYDVLDRIPGTHFEASFGHLEGYTSGYYTYMWSLVIAKDLFSAFSEGSMFDTEVSTRYRDRVLAPGGSRDAADLVHDFLGRPYGFDAFGAWLAERASPPTS